MINSSWNQDWFPTPGQAVFDRVNQQIASVSRAPGNLDLFVIGNDDHAWTTYWNAMGGWSKDWFPIPGQAVFDHINQQIAAVSRAPGNLDLFVIGNDNHVWTTFWNEGGGWNKDWFPIPGQAVFDRVNQQIAAVSRAPGNLDLFVIGNDNHVWTTYWNTAGGWSQDWFPIPGQAVFDRVNQQIAAVSRAPGNLDLFVIGNDNHVLTTFWNEGGGWNEDWFPIPGQAVFDRANQQIAAVSRAPGNLDLFVIGFDNHVWTTYWNAAGGWSQDWFPTPGQAVFDRINQNIAAVSRAPGNLDLFIIGNDNHVWTTFWNEGGGWNQDWFPLPGQAVFDRINQNTAAVSRSPDNLDLFIIGNDDHVWTTYWNNEPVVFDSGPLSCNLALGGGVHLEIRRNGNFTFSCHAHDSGFDNYDYTVLGVLLFSNGAPFSVQHSGHVAGTSDGLPFGAPSREDNFVTGGNNPSIANEWSGIVNARLSASINGTDKLIGGIEGALSDLLKSLAADLAQAAVAAMIALV